MFKRVALIFCLFLLLLPPLAKAQNAKEAPAPQSVFGEYRTTYYARFEDWPIFALLLPIRSSDLALPYQDRFDYSPEGQIIGQLSGEVQHGNYRIELPPVPKESAAYDTDGDPLTPSPVKVFMVGISNAMIGQDSLTPYDFLYSRSFSYDPNTRQWMGQLLVWSAQEKVSLPLLPGPDGQFYTPDDRNLSVPAGWSVAAIKGDSLRLLRPEAAQIHLDEAPQFQNVDLSGLSYAEAFDRLIDGLAQTYIFTDYRGVDWEALRREYGPQAAAANTPEAYLGVVQAALFSFRDGHLTLYGQGLPEWLFGNLGMQVFPVGGELMVMSVSDYSPAGQSSDIRPGSVILEINGQPALDYFEATPAMIFSTGHPSAQAWSRGDLVFRAAPGTYFRLKYRQPDGQVSTTALQTIPVGEIRSDPPPHAGEAAYYEVLPSGLGLIGIQNFTSSQVDDRWNEAMAALLAAEVPGLIIDLRRNGGGFGTVVNYILGDFLDEDVYAGRRVSSLDEDGDGLADTEDQIYFARARRFDPAKVIVLVGPECYSACEFAALAFQTVGAQVMGHTQTGGAGGGVGATYYLPNGIQVYGMAVVRMEDPAGQVVIEGQGVPLDVVVPFNPQDLSLGQDTLLRAAEAQLLSD